MCVRRSSNHSYFLRSKHSPATTDTPKRPQSFFRRRKSRHQNPDDVQSVQSVKLRIEPALPFVFAPNQVSSTRVQRTPKSARSEQETECNVEDEDETVASVRTRRVNATTWFPPIELKQPIGILNPRATRRHYRANRDKSPCMSVKTVKGVFMCFVCAIVLLTLNAAFVQPSQNPADWARPALIASWLWILSSLFVYYDSRIPGRYPPLNKFQLNNLFTFLAGICVFVYLVILNYVEKNAK